MTLETNYRDFHTYLFGDNDDTIQKTREGYYDSMGKYLSSYVEYVKESCIDVLLGRETNEDGAVIETTLGLELKENEKESIFEIVTDAWLFGMDLFTATHYVVGDEINFSRFVEPGEAKLEIFMEDEELKREALGKYDIEPCITYFVNLLLQGALEKCEGLNEFPFKNVATFKYTLSWIVRNTFLLCYLQFER